MALIALVGSGDSNLVGLEAGQWIGESVVGMLAFLCVIGQPRREWAEVALTSPICVRDGEVPKATAHRFLAKAEIFGNVLR